MVSRRVNAVRERERTRRAKVSRERWGRRAERSDRLAVRRTWSEGLLGGVERCVLLCFVVFCCVLLC